MDSTIFNSVDQLQRLLGDRLQRLRISKNFDQRTTAEKAGISEKALRNMEAGRGSTIETFLRTLKALDSLDGINLLVPEPTTSPLMLLRSAKVRQRVRHPRKASA